MPWIHEHSRWPEFTWDAAALAEPLAAVRHRQGRILGRMAAVGFPLRVEASVSSLTEEVVKSSAIEGERLNAGEVRSSIARRLGLDAGGLPEPGRHVDGIVEMMLDATRNFHEPLTAGRLFAWHAALFPTGHSGVLPITTGAWRTDAKGPMQVVSGRIGRERVHFQAPAASRLEGEMSSFLGWFNTPPPIDPIIKAAVAHFWAVTIHPFDDGNGRIARAIADMALAQADGVRDRCYSMSSAIERRRSEYYLQLESAQRGGLDITAWLAWFLRCLDGAIDQAEESLASVLFKARLWTALGERPVNERQRKAINRMLDNFEGGMTTSKYARLTRCSRDTALRDIRELVARGVLATNAGRGRSTSYRLVTNEELDEMEEPPPRLG